MRKTLNFAGYEFSFCVERNNHLIPGEQSNQVFHADFNIFKEVKQ